MPNVESSSHPVGDVQTQEPPALQGSLDTLQDKIEREYLHGAFATMLHLALAQSSVAMMLWMDTLQETIEGFYVLESQNIVFVERSIRSILTILYWGFYIIDTKENRIPTVFEEVDSQDKNTLSQITQNICLLISNLLLPWQWCMNSRRDISTLIEEKKKLLLKIKNDL